MTKASRGSGFSKSKEITEKPEVYSVSRSKSRRVLNRRRFLAGTSVAAAGALVGAQPGKAFQDRRSRRSDPAKKLISCQGVYATKSTADCLAFSNDGSLFVTGDWEGKIKLWSAPYWNLEKSISASETVISALALSPDGNWILSGDWDGQITVWSLKTKKLVKKIDAYWSTVCGIAITPDSKKMVSIGWEWGSKDAVKLWSLPDGKLLKRWGDYGPSGVLALSPDGQTLATEGEFPKAVSLWSMKAGEEGKLIASFGETFNSLSPSLLTFSGDGKYLFGAEELNANVKIWRMSDRQLIKNINAHPGGVKAIAVNKKGNLLATAGNDPDEYAKVWTLPGGGLRRTLGQGDEANTWATAAAFNPGNNLLHVFYPHRAKVWNAAKGKLLQCLVDLEVTLVSRYGRTYLYKAEGGKRVKVTVPACTCAPAMPKDAKCVCDTVPGEAVGGGCVVHVYFYPN
jgi:WD40 repeat protein